LERRADGVLLGRAGFWPRREHTLHGERVIIHGVERPETSP
jgi:hypothetical protein